MADMIKNKTDWLAARLRGIGASECSAIVGLSPYMSNVQLWEIKTGLTVAEDISDKPCVQYGHAAEPIIRDLFALDHPEYAVSYGGAFDMVHHPDYPWLFSTLDGRLEEKDTGRKGVLEIKTADLYSAVARQKWDGRIPDNYFCQVLHQLLSTGWDFAVLYAKFRLMQNGEPVTTLRSYKIDRADVQPDMDYLLEKEIAFWDMVQRRIRPNQILPDL